MNNQQGKYIQVLTPINEKRGDFYMKLLNSGYEIYSQRLLEGDIEETIFVLFNNNGFSIQDPN